MILRKPKAYGHTWLTRPRGFTRDLAEAESHIWIYGPCDWPGGEGWYSTSRLGMLNGLLRYVGLVVRGATVTVGPGRYIVGWEIKRRRG